MPINKRTIIKFFDWLIMDWLRSFRSCSCCGERSYDSTKGSSYCGDCDGGYCNGIHD